MYTRYQLGRGSLLAVIGVFVALICLFVGGIWWMGRDFATVSFDEKYYFLVRSCEETTSAAVSGQVYQAGGAGYLWGDCVVVACYYTEADALRVSSSMGERGVETSILMQESGGFSLNGKKAAQAVHIKANAETADTCAHILYDSANGLELGKLSQEEARVAVRGVAKSLKGLREGNKDSLYSKWNAELYRAEQQAEELASGILFAKDLRYLQVQICLAVLNIEEYF